MLEKRKQRSRASVGKGVLSQGLRSPEKRQSRHKMAVANRINRKSRYRRRKKGRVRGVGRSEPGQGKSGRVLKKGKGPQEVKKQQELLMRIWEEGRAQEQSVGSTKGSEGVFGVRSGSASRRGVQGGKWMNPIVTQSKKRQKKKRQLMERL